GGITNEGEIHLENRSHLFKQPGPPLFNSNQALFIDGIDGDIYPRAISGREESAIQGTFDKFYVWNILYDLTRQLVMADGEFSFDYFWLTSKFTYEEMKNWASYHFESVYGLSPDDFEIVAKNLPNPRVNADC
ncbi:MAG: hypothetical protein SCI25_15900, partial [Desulfuromonadales bacterium]|nr:hypothetical protein [Desulfuromonadales bacterium]